MYPRAPTPLLNKGRHTPHNKANHHPHPTQAQLKSKCIILKQERPKQDHRKDESSQDKYKHKEQEVFEVVFYYEST